MKLINCLIIFVFLLITSCASVKTSELSCHLLGYPSFPPQKDMLKMGNAINTCKTQAPNARVVFDPGWSCNAIWSVDGPDTDKMKKCLKEKFGWKELGPPKWIEGTMVAP